MKLIDLQFPCASMSDRYKFYVIGDAHVGARNCAEDKIQAMVKIIAADPMARWIGGGDLTDNIILSDQKRFDPSVLPLWMLEKRSGEQVVSALQDIVGAQRDRLYRLLDPIADKCLGLIEGNHEYSIMKHHNRDLMQEMCAHFGVPNLTDCTFMRMRFKRGTQTATVKAFISHGHGGGRTSGAEPNSLYRLSADKGADIIMQGHSHSFCIHSPITVLSVPNRGRMPKDLVVSYKYAGNWGAWVYTYQSGPSTYASRANYPARPMYTIETAVKPFNCTVADDGQKLFKPRIEMNGLQL